MLDVLNSEGVEAALPWFDEGFHGVVPPELSAEPDEYDGHDGVRRYFDSFDEIVTGLVFDADELVEVGEDAVVGRGVITGTGRASGIPTELRIAMLIRVRGGKVYEMSAYPDWDEAIAAAGTP